MHRQRSRDAGQAARLVADGDRAAAGELVTKSVAALATTPGAKSSDGIVNVLFSIGYFAYGELANYQVSGTAEGIARVHRERTLPEDHPQLLLARSNLANSMSRMGDLAGARALREAVLAA